MPCLLEKMKIDWIEARYGPFLNKLEFSWQGWPCESVNHSTDTFLIFIIKWSNRGHFLFIFILFSLQFQYKLNKSIDGVLGIQTQGRRMVGADETTELWRPLATDTWM